jgi:hypothetical protein
MQAYLHVYVSVAWTCSSTHLLGQSTTNSDRLCGTVVRVPRYRSISPGFDSVLPDLLRSSGSGTGPTQPRDCKSYLNEKWRLQSRKLRLTAVGTRRADHATPLDQQNPAKNSPASGGCSVGIVFLRTKRNGVCFFA